MNKIPVMNTASRVWNFATEQFATVLRLTWCPLSIVLLTQLVSTYFVLAVIRAAQAGVNAKFAAFLWPISMALFIMTATTIAVVALHRLILFGDDKPGQYVYLAFGKTEFLFLSLLVMIYIAMLILFVVAALITPYLSVLIGLAALFCIFRMFLIFPIIVVEGRYDFEQAWELGRGNIWRFIGLSLVVCLPVVVAIAIIGAVAGALIPNTFDPRTFRPAFGPRVIFDLVLQFVASIVSTALGVGVVSYSYKAAKGLPLDSQIRTGA